MTDLFEMREWLSIDEAIRYLNFHLDGTHPANIQDLASLAEEKRLTFYWKNLGGNLWQNIGDHFEFFSSPNDYIKAGKSEISTEYKSGYFPVCVDSLDLLPSFRDCFLEALDFQPHFEHRTSTRIIVKESYASDNLLAALERSFHQDIEPTFLNIHLDKLIEDFWLSRTELKTLIQQIKNPHETIEKTQEKQLTSKTENSYLRLIQALAEYATDGLTGKPSTDANAIEAALKSKDIQCPVGNKALAGYLEKAQQISK